ncbi:MAG: PorV/PorQ family protein [Candidatus Poribacteria bacterium]|nr:PorV/PorQ family protein [Candidatus Poribacteria bacterium]
MPKRLELKFCLTVIFAIISLPSLAVDIHEDAGTTGAAFLKIEGGSRPIGMGGAFVGLANDVNTIYWNPSGLTSVRDREFTAMQNFSIADISNQFIGYTQRLGEKGAWGASFLGAFTEIERRRGPTDEPDSTVTVGGFAVGLSFAYALSPELSVGATAKGISQQLDTEDSLGAAADVGVLFRLLDNQLGIGVAAQNLGFLDTEEDLPMNVRGGIAYQIRTKPSIADPTPPRDLFALVADVNVPIVAGYPTFHVGAENWLYDVLAIRVGYSISKGENPRNGLTGGIGLRRTGEASLENISFQFDYAFVPDEDVGDAHRISLILRF